MPKPTVQQCHALISYYIDQYTEAKGSAPVLNRNRAKYGFEGILMDHSGEDARQLVRYYISHYEEPSADWFIYNYDKVYVAMQEHEAREEASKKRREQTARRLEEWRKRWEK